MLADAVMCYVYILYMYLHIMVRNINDQHIRYICFVYKYLQYDHRNINKTPENATELLYKFIAIIVNNTDITNNQLF